MAGPIRISILADAASATAGVKQLSADVEQSVGRTASSLGDLSEHSRRAGKDTARGFEAAGEGADKAEQRAQGFRDTLTGVGDVMSGTSQIAKGDLFGGLVTLGGGFADIAGGAAGFLIPALQKAAGAMKALNLTFLTNPVFLVVAAIVALVAVFVIAYKRSETFRRIVNAAFGGVLAGARAVWGWIRAAFPVLMSWISNPFRTGARLATAAVSGVVAFVRRVPGWIKGVFSGAGSWLWDAGKQIVVGLLNGILSLQSWLIGKVQGFIARVVPGPIRSALGISSPSKVTRQLGRFVGEGLALGLGDRVDAVAKASGGLAAASVPTLAGGGLAGSGGLAGAGGISITFGGTGDPLLDAILVELRRRIRISGGDVQAFLGRA